MLKITTITVPRLPAEVKWVAAALLAYESVALASGRVPTLTALAERYRPLAPVLIVGLAAHLYLNPPRPVIVELAGEEAEG
jgi:hypothetical protein